MPTNTSNNLTDAAEAAALDYLLDGGYIALFTTKPNEAGSGGVEVSGGGYVRKAASWNAASGGSKTLAAALTWTASGGNYGTIVAVGLFTASSGGVLRSVWDVSPTETVNDGGSFTLSSLTQTLN